ncbi:MULTISPECIES: DUF86 domain-containing protein [Bacillus]|uniref:DUF86 domain-containing protein n=1 Tax=Bacillus gobiensis TaxID=1441095 RepID=A0A0M4G9X7_9BACI|nr:MULTISPECIES: DUF86 domain-containing protein [Bacillus]ALC82253.1 hypothetical protein AM592_12190 [Bacillus gobiensis]MED1095792.1 DUF86 domain-containing protein [Bacillus capparidis]
MYFVDQKQIEETLVFFEKNLELYRNHSGWKTEIEKKAFERIAHLLIECVLDAGNMMIDGFIMRDAGSYNDILDILMDEKVITNQEGQTLKKLVSMRKKLVQQYTQIDELELVNGLAECTEVLQRFPERIRIYLRNELGPVSAFK